MKAVAYHLTFNDAAIQQFEADAEKARKTDGVDEAFAVAIQVGDETFNFATFEDLAAALRGAK